MRISPIFPDLRQHLLAVKKRAKGKKYVVAGVRKGNENIRTEFLRIIKRVGLQQWPKLCQNMRASRSNELCAIYPRKDVDEWCGNTEEVRFKFYDMPLEESFRRAVKDGIDGKNGGAKSGTVGVKTLVNVREPW